MKHIRRFALLVAFFAVSTLCWAQGANTLTLRFPGAPTGTCAPIMYAVNNSTGELFDCKGGAWSLVGPGAAGGSTTQLQYNNATALGGISGWTTNGTTTVTGGATSVLDLSSMAPASGLKIPGVAGAVPTADGFIGTNLTNHTLAWGSNGTTIVGAAAATGTGTATTCASSKWVSTVSSLAVPTCTQPAASDLTVAALANGITATTQTAASNDTKVATDAYVDGHFIANGTAAMGTSAISSGACATVVTVSATGVATTDVVKAGFNGDPTAVTGYGASATGAVLTIYPYPTANNVNFKVCNSTSASITPGALTLNWNVTR